MSVVTTGNVLFPSRVGSESIERALAPYLEILRHQFAPERVILFGSYAYATPTWDNEEQIEDGSSGWNREPRLGLRFAGHQLRLKQAECMRLSAEAVIARSKITDYLLVHQARSDKSAFLALGGFLKDNPDVLIAELTRLRVEVEADQVGSNFFGYYYELVGILRGPVGVGLKVKTVWMTEHLSGLTKFITLVPIKILKS